MCSVALIAGACTSIADTERREAVDLVQKFYTGYAEKANRADASEPAWTDVARTRPEDLDSTFLRLLLRDAEERSKGRKGEISGIDWDPFLNSQDPCSRYTADSLAIRQAQFRVRVTEVCEADRPARRFEMVLELRSRKWAIVTVQDSAGYDAVSTLKASYPDH